MKEWEVWFAEFPFEEDAAVVKKRPVIILNVETLEVLSHIVDQNLIAKQFVAYITSLK